MKKSKAGDLRHSGTASRYLTANEIDKSGTEQGRGGVVAKRWASGHTAMAPVRLTQFHRTTPPMLVLPPYAGNSQAVNKSLLPLAGGEGGRRPDEGVRRIFTVDQPLRRLEFLFANDAEPRISAGGAAGQQ